MKNQTFWVRLGYAAAGMRAVFQSERSFRTQCLVAVAALIVLIGLRPGWLWAALVISMIVLVLAFELMNSALEALIDKVHPEIAPAIKVAKDAAAGAVLMVSLGALVVGAFMVFDWLRR